MMGVYVSGRYAYVAADRFGLMIIDVTDPSNPGSAGGYYSMSDAYDVLVRGNYAYIAAGTSGLLIIDISDHSDLILVGSFRTPCLGYGLSVDNEYVCVADLVSLMVLRFEPPESNCEYIPGDVDHNGVPIELADVIAMISIYRGVVEPGYTCDCPPHGVDFAAGADPNGNCVPFELPDVVIEIAAYRGFAEVSGCPDCPGLRR
jgi:hypothetical protein